MKPIYIREYCEILASWSSGIDQCNSQHEASMNIVLSYDESYWSERISSNFLICISWIETSPLNSTLYSSSKTVTMILIELCCYAVIFPQSQKMHSFVPRAKINGKVEFHAWFPLWFINIQRVVNFYEWIFLIR